MNPMKEAFPTIEVGEPHHQFDLHNDGDLREISYSGCTRPFASPSRPTVSASSGSSVRVLQEEYRSVSEEGIDGTLQAKVDLDKKSAKKRVVTSMNGRL
jgi:hypothetical protein